MAAQTDTAPNVMDTNGMGQSNGESHISSENEPTAKKMRLCDPEAENTEAEVSTKIIPTNGETAQNNGSSPSESPTNQQTSVVNGSAYHDTSTNHNANTQESTNQHAQDEALTNHSTASSETANQSVFGRLLANEHALGAVLERLDVTDWLQLELTNQEWRKAMLVAWRGRRAVDGYQLFQAVRCQTYGRQLKSFLIPYARTTTERREKLLQLVQFISSRCVSVRSAKRIMSACLVDSSDFCTAQIADEFAKMEHLRVLDFSGCKPKLNAVVRLLESIGETLEELNISGILSDYGGKREFTGAVIKRKTGGSVALAEMTGMLQRCFSCLENLRRLDISYCAQSDGNFLTRLPNPDKLEYLNIAHSPELNFQKLQSAGFFIRCTSLKEIDYPLKKDDSMTKAKRFLQCLPDLVNSLESLNLSGWQASEGLTGPDFIQSLCQLTKLQTLNLDSCRGLLRDEALKQLCRKLPNLCSLSIYVNQIVPEHFSQLKRLEHLTVLKLSHTVPKVLKSEQLTAIASLPLLHTLDVGSPAVGTDLDPIYSGCKALRDLAISGHAASDELLQEYGTRLPETVTVLRFAAGFPEDNYGRDKKTPPGDAGIVALVSTRGQTLTGLYLNSLKLTDVGLRKIGTCCPNLEVLWLADKSKKSEKFTDKGLEAAVNGCASKLGTVYIDTNIKERLARSEILVPAGILVEEC